MTDPLESDFRRLLPTLPVSQVQVLLDTVAHLDLDRMNEPETGLIMITANDCYQHPFHLGEMLVTRAEIEFDGIPAHATVMGDAAEAALLAATLNALLRHPNADELTQSFRERWPDIAREAQARIDEEQHVAATTNVAFESMAEEEEI